MKRNKILWLAIAACTVSIVISSCKGCSKSEQEAWDNFLKHAKECADKRDAFMTDCNRMKEADAWAELQACKNACPFDIGACGIDINCITEKINERLLCLTACEEKYRQRIQSNEECETKWNTAFMDCLTKTP